MLDLHVHRGVGKIGAAEWDACFPGVLERHACLAAIEGAGLEGFDFRALALRDGGRVIACAPAFLTRYDIATTLDVDGRRVAAGLRRVLPRLVTPMLVCLGSPCTEVAPIGLAPHLLPPERHHALRRLLAGLDEVAVSERADLVALKDVAAGDMALIDRTPEVGRFGRVPGLPVAALDIDFTSLDDYLSRLSPGTRRDMRRKLRSADGLRIERVQDIDPLLDRVMQLYNQTRARAEMKFEALTAAYFQRMLACDGAFMTLYWQGDRLLAANLLIEGETTLLDKFFCMDLAEGRPLNLYFVSWFENLRHCLARGLCRYQAGQAAYASKLRLGCTLEPTQMLFRHRNPVLHRLLAFAAPRLSAEPPLGQAA